jgi:hypothetical protein
MMLLASRLYTIDEGITNECGTDGMGTGKGSIIFRENLPQCQIVHR